MLNSCRRVRAMYPDWNLELHEGQTEDLFAWTDRGELDLALLALEAELGGLESQPLFSNLFVVALRTGHRLARRNRLRQPDLRDEKILLLSDGHRLRDQVLSVCDWASRKGELEDFRATSLATLVQGVASGSGVTLADICAVGMDSFRLGVSVLSLLDTESKVMRRRGLC
jgi:LysR family hydrogen peroxide-inducible transcriptional activator